MKKKSYKAPLNDLQRKKNEATNRFIDILQNKTKEGALKWLTKTDKSMCFYGISQAEDKIIVLVSKTLKRPIQYIIRTKSNTFVLNKLQGKVLEETILANRLPSSQNALAKYIQNQQKVRMEELRKQRELKYQQELVKKYKMEDSPFNDPLQDGIESLFKKTSETGHKKIFGRLQSEMKDGKTKWIVTKGKDAKLIYLGISTTSDEIVAAVKTVSPKNPAYYLIMIEDNNKTLQEECNFLDLDKIIFRYNPELLSPDHQIQFTDPEIVRKYILKRQQKVQKISDNPQSQRVKEKGQAVQKNVPIPEVRPIALPSSQRKKISELEQSQIDIHDLVVRRAVFKCMHEKHEIQNLVADVSVIDKYSQIINVKVSAGYCKTCGVYFILESSYEKLRKKGIPMCRITDEKTYESSHFVNGMMLAQESILMQYGYNVNQSEGLTDTRRHKILAVLIDNKILSKSEIISYLDFFIRQRQYQAKFEKAIEKWEKDRAFVEEYRIGDYNLIGVKSIHRK